MVLNTVIVSYRRRVTVGCEPPANVTVLRTVRVVVPTCPWLSSVTVRRSVTVGPGIVTGTAMLTVAVLTTVRVKVLSSY